MTKFSKKIRKAIFPVGGLGTRFLPATKSIPKEMLPVLDKPLVQYAVDEALEAGIEEFIFVTGRNKSAIEDHFDHSFELENNLLANCVANVHDEWQVEVLEKEADQLGQLGVDAIRTAGVYYNLNCPLDGEYKIGGNWSETH